MVQPPPPSATSQAHGGGGRAQRRHLRRLNQRRHLQSGNHAPPAPFWKEKTVRQSMGGQQEGGDSSPLKQVQVLLACEVHGPFLERQGGAAEISAAPLGRACHQP